MRQLITTVAVLLMLTLGIAVRAENPSSAAADLWKRRCAACHGPDGRGATQSGRKHSIPDLTSSAWQASRTDGQVRATILDGGENMPGYSGKLSHEEVDLLVRHVRSFGRPAAGR